MGHIDLTEQRSTLPAEGERLNVVAAEIRVLKGQAQQMALSYAVEIGRRLTEAKAMVPYGEWGEWLKREVDYSQSTAQNLMKVYRELDDQTSLFGPSKAQALGELSFTNVLRILTLPEGPERDEFLAEHDVASMSTRELDQALKERDEARMAAEQAKAEQSAAEQARQKMEQDMAVANERIAGLNAEVEQRSAEAMEKAEEAARLAAELEELRSRPVDVAVQADEAAIEAARGEVEAAMQDRVDRAAAARDEALAKRYELEEALNKVKLEHEQAEIARKAAEEAQAAAQQELERVRAEAQAVRERAAQSEKKTAIGSNEDVMLFKALFDQTQEQVNKMGGVLMKLRPKDPDTAGRLSQALLALSEKVREVAAQ